MNDMVLDASFVLKWILSEEREGVREAREIRAEIQRGKLKAMIPEILITEVLNVLFWKKISKEMILKFMERIEDGGIRIIALSDFNKEELLEVMEKYKITVYDAYYVVLAKKNKCKLLSFDKKLKGVGHRKRAGRPMSG